MSTELSKINETDLGCMKVHEVLEHKELPYFRVMRVPNGWLYNFYESGIDNYGDKWIFVQEKNN